MESMVKPPIRDPKTAPPEKVDTMAPIMAVVSVVWKKFKKFSLLMTASDQHLPSGRFGEKQLPSVITPES
jgi:hypothetical protein